LEEKAGRLARLNAEEQKVPQTYYYSLWEHVMQNIGLILLVFAFVIMCIAMRIGSVGGWSLLPMALAFYIGAELIGGVGKVFH
jgi:hypothetical protein